MTFRYSGANGGGNGEQQLYYDEREKMRGRSVNPPHYRERQQPRYDPRNDPRYGRDAYRDRYTVDRERFAKYQPDDDYDEDVEQQASHMSRRDRMRDRRGSPPQERNMRENSRYSEDRQMSGGSPRYMKAGRKLLKIFKN